MWLAFGITLFAFIGLCVVAYLYKRQLDKWTEERTERIKEAKKKYPNNPWKWY